MKYEEIVAKVKKALAKADASKVDGHLAVQVDVTGEGEGAFYIEVADGKVTVEPYEYYDHDFKVLCDAEEIIAIAEGKKKLGAEVDAGNAYVSRDIEKVAVFDSIAVKKAAAKKAPAKKAEKKEYLSDDDLYDIVSILDVLTECNRTTIKKSCFEERKEELLKLHKELIEAPVEQPEPEQAF